MKFICYYEVTQREANGGWGERTEYVCVCVSDHAHNYQSLLKS